MTIQEATRELTDSEITEAYFRARGWVSSGVDWLPPKATKVYNDLPNILESNSAFIEHVLEVMEGAGCMPLIEALGEGPRIFFVWDFGSGASNEEIINNNFFRAATIAATRYWESKK